MRSHSIAAVGVTLITITVSLLTTPADAVSDVCRIEPNASLYRMAKVKSEGALRQAWATEFHGLCKTPGSQENDNLQSFVSKYFIKKPIDAGATPSTRCDIEGQNDGAFVVVPEIVTLCGEKCAEVGLDVGTRAADAFCRREIIAFAQKQMPICSFIETETCRTTFRQRVRLNAACADLAQREPQALERALELACDTLPSPIVGAPGNPGNPGNPGWPGNPGGWPGGDPGRGDGRGACEYSLLGVPAAGTWTDGTRCNTDNQCMSVAPNVSRRCVLP